MESDCASQRVANVFRKRGRYWKRKKVNQSKLRAAMIDENTA